MLRVKETGSADSAVDKALGLFKRQRARVPNIAVLGPPGSGKSLFLNRLIDSLSSQEEGTSPIHCLHLDLRHLPVGELDEIYDAVNYALLRETAETGIAPVSEINLRIPHLRFEEILRHLLATVKGKLLVVVDHLESAPRFFASDLNHRFRNFIEASEQNFEYRRLGFVVAGSVSLFDLKQETDSAYSMFKLILLPDLNPEVCQRLVEDRLKTSLLNDTSREVVELLAAETSGEPGFLEPVIQALKMNQQGPLNKDVVRSAIEGLVYDSQVPSLRHLALHLWTDVELRDTVRHLHRGSTATPGYNTPDIDRFQLSGAVVVSSDANFHSYRFRNGMVARYLTYLLDALDNANSGTPSDLPLLKWLRSLDEIKSGCLRAEQIWKCAKYLREAWKQTTRYSLPNICFYVIKHGSTQGWWLDARSREVSGPEGCKASSISTKLSAFSAISSLRASHGSSADSMRTFFCWDREYVSVGVPLSSPDVAIVVVATLLRTEVGNNFTEFALSHWIRFVQTVKPSVFTLALAEMGKKKLAEECDDTKNPSNTHLPRPADGVVGKNRVRHLYWLPGNGALFCKRGGVLHFSGGIDPKTVDVLNNMCRDLVTRWGDRIHFQQQLDAISHQFHTAIKNVDGLFEQLILDSLTDQLVITSNVEGLKLPFELLAHEKNHLALMLPLSRRLIDSNLSLKMNHTFQNLFSSLVKNKGTLRVLLIGSEAGGNLTNAVTELRAVRGHIEAGCEQAGLNVYFKTILPTEATAEAVETELVDHSPYHIFHYSGHVLHFSEAPDASGIVLRGEDDDPDVISCDRLKQWAGNAGLWLAYLSSCHSSSVSGNSLGSSQRYLGTIEAMAHAGVPNVVGFRCLVSDAGAFQLASEFYRQLFRQQGEKSLSWAMFKARSRMVGRPKSFDAWASSMLVTQII
ncbi:MAG TPA: CHAT domain-containing protein [Blastocatellia bacterium]|nr:CHAT domain-containing protein [Blastocatellia bacterium]